jgi:hypothetical protein
MKTFCRNSYFWFSVWFGLQVGCGVSTSKVFCDGLFLLWLRICVLHEKVDTEKRKEVGGCGGLINFV